MRLFLEPTETLLFRTGRPFDVGESNYADTLFPPTPETLQGAIRAAIATHWNRSLTLAEAFQHKALVDLIGDRTQYGRFRITGIALGRRKADGTVERLFPAPVHLLQMKDKQGTKQIIRLRPQAMEGVYSDMPTGTQYLLAEKEIDDDGADDVNVKAEPLGGWLTERGLLMALRPNEDIPQKEIVNTHGLHGIFEYEPRLGIGMNSTTKTTEEGLLYQTRMIRMRYDQNFVYGFVVDISLARSSETNKVNTHLENPTNDDQTEEFPLDQGWITIGGERRVAHFEVLKRSGTVQPDALDQTKKGNLLYLATPAVFSRGWQPMWASPLATPIAAAIDRYRSIGGWLLEPGNAGGSGKTMRRCVPAGSVYFFDKPVTISHPLTDYGWQIGYGIAYAGEW